MLQRVTAGSIPIIRLLVISDNDRSRADSELWHNFWTVCTIPLVGNWLTATDRPTDRPNNQPTNQRTNRPTDRPINKLPSLCGRIAHEIIIIIIIIIIPQPVNKFPSFYTIRRFITVFTTARHLSLSWARWIQSTPSRAMPLTLLLILSSHLCLDDSFSALTKPLLYTFPFNPIRATCPTHLIPSDRITRNILCNILHSLITSSLSGPNIFLSTFTNTLNLCYDQVSHPNNRYNCSSVHFKLFIFGQQLEHKTIWTHW